MCCNGSFEQHNIPSCILVNLTWQTYCTPHFSPWPGVLPKGAWLAQIAIHEQIWDSVSSTLWATLPSHKSHSMNNSQRHHVCLWNSSTETTFHSLLKAGSWLILDPGLVVTCCTNYTCLFVGLVWEQSDCGDTVFHFLFIPGSICSVTVWIFAAEDGDKQRSWGVRICDTNLEREGGREGGRGRREGEREGKEGGREGGEGGRERGRKGGRWRRDRERRERRRKGTRNGGRLRHCLVGWQEEGT